MLKYSIPMLFLLFTTTTAAMACDAEDAGNATKHPPQTTAQSYEQRDTTTLSWEEKWDYFRSTPLGKDLYFLWRCSPSSKRKLINSATTVSDDTAIYVSTFFSMFRKLRGKRAEEEFVHIPLESEEELVKTLEQLSTEEKVKTYSVRTNPTFLPILNFKDKLNIPDEDLDKDPDIASQFDRMITLTIQANTANNGIKEIKKEIKREFQKSRDSE